MAQEMRVETNGHVGCGPRWAADFRDAGWVDRLSWRASRKQPLWRPIRLPVRAQQHKQLGRQHAEPILMAFGLRNPDDHPLALQVGQAKGAEFREPEPRGIERGEDGAMLQVTRGHQDGSDIGGAQDRGEPALPPGRGNMFQHPLVPEGGVREEAESTDGLVKGGPGDLPVMGEIVLVGADVFRSQAIGGV